MPAEPSTQSGHFDERDSLTAQPEPVWIGIDIGNTRHHTAEIDNTGPATLVGPRQQTTINTASSSSTPVALPLYD